MSQWVTEHLQLRIHVPKSNETLTTLQRQNTEISKQIFPEKEYRGLSPNFHIHPFVSHLYISTIGLPILLEEICRPILGLYKSLTDTWMLKLGMRPRYSQKRNTYMGFSLQCSGRSHSTEQQNINQWAPASNRAPKHYPMGIGNHVPKSNRTLTQEQTRSKMQQNIDQGEATFEVRPYSKKTKTPRTPLERVKLHVCCICLLCIKHTDVAIFWRNVA